MAMHELASNAGKYGALSVESGRIAIGWRVDETHGTRLLRLEWRDVAVHPLSRLT